MQHPFAGSGPGVQTRDGCSVELYKRFAYMGELAEIEDELRAHGDVLELGCGTGRLCRHLLALGLRVTGVDESADMLACMPAGAQRVHSAIEQLDLARQWPAVLLPSHMINHPDAATRTAFVRTARRHVAPGGSFYVSCYPQRWLERVENGSLGAGDGVSMFAENVVRQDGLVSMTIRYRLQDDEWTHSATAALLSKAQIEALLQAQGFAQARWFERGPVWVAVKAGHA